MQHNGPSADKKVSPHPTSPWTEVFQPTTLQPDTDKTTSQTDPKRPQAAGADSARATQEALAVIFNKKQ